ncbi:permease for cytosine/purines, uracil, thiamine, allantoin-domain-containing protein [Irpex rosettiformis]|uniref:Permease for cytosine/purines, uracil, thiamine, allantoin-domain-containing protein n=1 Tax=Irpex rosettiformis TaxID=378272 RepID=A0ACB8U274_9APHY|nr:permease for cytosine/purines, uracil, thiamine, allantoin-domain-containing protein [Irpex rosettiformis]
MNNVNCRINPVPENQRTDTRLYQVFFAWFAANANVLTFGAGSVGPAAFGLGMKESFLTIIVTDLIACIFPSMFTVFGPKLGTRAMVQSRFSWGYYGAVLPSIFNVLSMQGYLIINCIIGGQTLASVSSHLNAATGIVITGLISLAVTFCGYQTLHWYEMLSWVPNVITFVIMLGVGGKTLVSVPTSAAVPATAASIITFGSALAVTILAWCPIVPDYGIFHDAKGSSMRIFIYAYLGFFFASVPVHLIGAAFTAAAAYVPAWGAGLNSATNVGGLVAAVLQPIGGFGKFLLVLLALTTPSASAPTMYTVCTSFMTIAPVFARVPRFVFAIVSTAILIPVGIVGATRFYATFTQVLSFIGYWIAPFLGIVLTEHFLFRCASWKAYSPIEAWNDPRHPNLARGYAAIFTFGSSIGLIVVCMSQVWWTGPVARAGTGDIAMIVSFVYSVVVFSITRALERKRWREV